MDGIDPYRRARNSLHALGDLGGLAPQFGRRGEAVVFFGVRPSPEWLAHGVTPRQIVGLVDGRLQVVRLLKQRWRRRGTNETQHSRPPCEVGSGYCELVILLELFLWMSGEAGLLNVGALFDDVNEGLRPSRRTVARWMARALVVPMRLQQAVRSALIESSEPRPEELFPDGLSPPGSLKRRWRKRAPAVEELWRGTAMALYGAEALGVAAPLLLAEARGRCTSSPPQHWL